MAVGTTVIAIAQVPVVFLGVVPSVETLLAASSETEAQRIRYARDAAALTSVAVGVVLSIAARDPEPFLFTVATTAIMYYVVERITLAQIGNSNVN